MMRCDSPATILVVEDDSALAETLRDGFTTNNYVACIASTGAAAEDDLWLSDMLTLLPTDEGLRPIEASSGPESSGHINTDCGDVLAAVRRRLDEVLPPNIVISLNRLCHGTASIRGE